MSKKNLIDLIGILLLGLIIVVGYKLSPQLLPAGELALTPKVANCDLQTTPCQADWPGRGVLTLNLTPKPIPLMSRFEIEVTLPGVQVDQVELDFSGVDMPMGFNRFPLAALGAGRYVGQASLPVCVTGAMRWQATVMMTQGSKRITAPFQFVAGNKGS